MIRIQKSHEGLLHDEMGIPRGKNITIGALMAKKKKDKKEHNIPGERRDVFALNAKEKFNR